MPDLIRHPAPCRNPAFAGKVILTYFIAGVLTYFGKIKKKKGVMRRVLVKRRNMGTRVRHVPILPGFSGLGLEAGR
jgi:hypothetical protein